MLDELWAALSGASGVALACCLVATTVVLRWRGRRTARGAAARARQRQQAALENMDKAAQRFRLQVTVGVGVRGEGGHPQRHFKPRGALGGAGGGQRRFVTFGAPPRPDAFCTLPEPGGAKGRKGIERGRAGCGGPRCTGSKRSFAPCQRISRSLLER